MHRSPELVLQDDGEQRAAVIPAVALVYAGILWLGRAVKFHRPRH